MLKSNLIRSIEELLFYKKNYERLQNMVNVNFINNASDLMRRSPSPKKNSNK